MTSRGYLRDLSIGICDRRIIPCTSSSAHAQTLVVHALTEPLGGITSVGELLGPMPHLSSLEIQFLRGTFSFGHQNMRIILALVRDTRPGSLAHLKVVFEGLVRIPALRDGKAGASEDLRRLDDVLSSFPGMAGVTFVIPRETKQRYTFWSTAFQDCFVRLRERGCLIDTPTYGALLSSELCHQSYQPTNLF